jgi:chromate transporter
MSSVPDTASTAPDALAAPRSKTELFTAFTSLSLQGFGGVLPVAQRELVERRRWLNKEQFVEMLAVSQVLPGPNVVNLALMFGDRCFGLRGAFVALAGMLLAPMIIVLALTALYGHYADSPVVTGALRGMGAVAAGLIISTGLKLLTTLKRNAMGLPICLGLGLATILATAWLRLPLVWVILGLGSLAIAVAWAKLRP